MTLAPTNRFMNWSGLTFASTPILGVKRCSFDSGIQDLREAADNDAGTTIGLVVAINPTFSFETINAAVLLSSSAGIRGVFSATLNDANNKAAVGGGGYTFTTNDLSYMAQRSTQGDFNQLATETVTINTVWIDGVTNPVTISGI